MIWTTGAKSPWEPTSTPLPTDVRLQVWPWSFLVFQLYSQLMATIDEAKLTYLLDRLAIIDVQLRYATGADTRDWALYRSCFTDEIDTDFTSVFGGQPRRGNADRFVEAARRFLTGLKATQHMITNHCDHDRRRRSHLRCIRAGTPSSAERNGRRRSDYVRLLYESLRADSGRLEN